MVDAVVAKAVSVCVFAITSILEHAYIIIPYVDISVGGATRVLPYPVVVSQRQK